MSEETPWWRGAVVYQVYVRSFCDGNGDGQGDFRGLIGKLDYIARLGADAIWLSPIHPSPNRDWGYDVADYDGVHPDYGTLADFDALIAQAHSRGLKVLLDEVLCHTSDEHAWFLESMSDSSGAKSDWYVWADPRDDGTAPNNWLSAFGGPAWSYQPARRQYYHHKFLRQQPKLNWHNDDARNAALGVLDEWLGRGADGFRLDVANAYLHDKRLTDNPPVPPSERTRYHWAHAPNMQRHFHDSNLVENRRSLAQIREVVERHKDRFVFGEFSEEFERAGAFLSPDQGLHAGYTFAFLNETRRDPDFVRRYFALLAHHPRHWPCMSFSNHDVIRTVTRFGGGPSGNPALARLMLAVLFSLKGTVLLYQGEELGLPEADLRRDQLRDPVGDLYYPVAKGRDGCRTPMPWDARAPGLGFTTGTPWLPLAPAHKPLAVSVQETDTASTLNYARRFLATRKTSAALRLGEISFIDMKSPLLGFVREHGDERIICIFNLDEVVVEGAASLIGGANALPVGTGEVKAEGERLVLGPFAAFIGRL